MVREPQALQKRLGINCDKFNLSFTAIFAEDDNFFFTKIQPSRRILHAVDECKDCELLYIGDAHFSTNATLEDPRWKLELLATWVIPSANRPGLSEIRGGSRNRTIGDDSEIYAKAVFASHPAVVFLPRTSVNGAREDLLLKLGDHVSSVSVRTASTNPSGSISANITITKAGVRNFRSFEDTCDVHCFVNKARCYMLRKDHDEPLHSALGNKARLTLNEGELDAFEISPGELVKIEALLQRQPNTGDVGISSEDDVKDDTSDAKA